MNTNTKLRWSHCETKKDFGGAKARRRNRRRREAQAWKAEARKG